MKHLTLRSLAFCATLVLAAGIWSTNLSAAVTTVSDAAEFDDLLKQGTVIAKFSTKWCGPCKEFEPVFKEVSGMYDATFVTLNGDMPGIKPLEKRYGVDGYPTVLLFKKGKKIANLAPMKGVFEMMLDNHCTKKGSKAPKPAEPMEMDQEAEEMEIEQAPVKAAKPAQKQTPKRVAEPMEEPAAKRTKTAASDTAQKSADTVVKKKEVTPKAPKLPIINTVEEFKQARADNDVLLVKFSTAWCGVCTEHVDPIIEKLAQIYTDVRFVTIDCDAKATAPLCREYKITGLPTVYVFGRKSGKFERLEGGKNRYLYEKTIKTMIKTEKDAAQTDAAEAQPAAAPAQEATRTTPCLEKNEAATRKKK